MIYRIALAMVLLSPLLFGSVYAWSWAPLAGIAGALLIAWALELALLREKPAIGLRTAWPIVLPFLAVLIWTLLQTLEMIPATWHHPLWESASEALQSDMTGSISLNHADTRDAALRLLTYGAVFWLAFQYGRDVKKAELGLYALIAAGTFYALYGLFMHFSGWRMILWSAKLHHLDDLTGTFLNRNSFATYAGLSLLCVTGLILRDMLRAIETSDSFRQRLEKLVQGFGKKGWIALLCWGLLFTALLLSHSRAGLFSTLLALTLLFIACGATRAVRRPGYLAGAALFFLVASAGFLALSGGELDKRLASAASDFEARSRIYEHSLEAFKTAPWLGSGYGTFEEVFRFHRSDDIRFHVDKAHNTYLEAGIELGLPGALLLVASLAAVFWFCLMGLRKRRKRTIYPAIAIAAIVLVAVHSTIDFSLQIPGVALTFAFLTGFCTAQSFSSRRPADPW